MWASAGQIYAREKCPNACSHHKQKNKCIPIHHMSWRGTSIDLKRANQSKSKWSGVNAGGNGCIYCMSTVKWSLSHHQPKGCWGKRLGQSHLQNVWLRFAMEWRANDLTLWSNNFKIEPKRPSLCSEGGKNGLACQGPPTLTRMTWYMVCELQQVRTVQLKPTSTHFPYIYLSIHCPLGQSSIYFLTEFKWCHHYLLRSCVIDGDLHSYSPSGNAAITQILWEGNLTSANV